jgi:hypothetical protein
MAVLETQALTRRFELSATPSEKAVDKLHLS